MSTIQEKAKAISSIGQDAEMLALNAAIEAARAGEIGRGFAVVADSMESLAKSSQEMSQEIQEVMTSSYQDINSLTQAIHTGSNALIERSSLLVSTFSNVSESVSEMSDNISNLDVEFSNTLNVVTQETENTRTSMEGMIREFTVRANDGSGLEILDLSPQEAKAKLSQFDYLIDVRRPEEYTAELGRINGTKLITLQTEFPDAVKSLPKDKSYLFICRSGGRSMKAAQQALMHQIKDVSNLQGGMLAWRDAGF